MFDLETILLKAAGGAVVGGVFWIYVLSWFGHWVGRWFGGNALPSRLRAAMAWPSVVYIATGVIWIPEVVVFGRELFMSGQASSTINVVLWINFVVVVGALLGRYR